MSGKPEPFELLSDEHVVCDVCRDGGWTEENMIVFCEGFCGITVHQNCYGVPVIPEGDIPWFCDVCAPAGTGLKPRSQYQEEHFCILCLGRGGALKEVKKGSSEWIHVSCALASPEIYFHDSKLVEGVGGLDSMALARRRVLSCEFCTRANGMCVQCAGPNCNVAFHVRCGQDEGLKFELKAKAGRKRAYCKAHQYLYGQHEALCNKQAVSHVNRFTAGVQQSSSRYSCTDLWNAVSAFLDDESSIIERLKGNEIVELPVATPLGRPSKRGRRNFERERINEIIDDILKRCYNPSCLTLQEMFVSDRSPEFTDKFKSNKNAQWVRALYVLGTNENEMHQDLQMCEKLSFCFRCTLNDLPSVPNSINLLKMRRFSTLEYLNANHTDVERDIWSLNARLETQKQTSSRTMMRLRQVLRPQSRAMLQPKLLSKRVKKQSKGHAKKRRTKKLTEGFLRHEKKFNAQTKRLRLFEVSTQEQEHNEVRSVLQYLVGRIIFEEDRRISNFHKRRPERRALLRKSMAKTFETCSPCYILTIKCIDVNVYSCS